LANPLEIHGKMIVGFQLLWIELNADSKFTHGRGEIPFEFIPFSPTKM